MIVIICDMIQSKFKLGRKKKKHPVTANKTKQNKSKQNKAASNHKY